MTEAIIIQKPVSKSMDWFLYDNDLHRERVIAAGSNENL